MTPPADASRNSRPERQPAAWRLLLSSPAILVTGACCITSDPRIAADVDPAGDYGGAEWGGFGLEALPQFRLDAT